MDKNFEIQVKKFIADYLNCTPEDIYTVWSCKTLQNIKGLFSSNVENAKGLYYEATYNGDKQELYIDSYRKQKNELFKVTL